MAIVKVHGHVCDQFLGIAPRIPVLPVKISLADNYVVVIAEN
jgi:hypothetical protein